MEINQEILNGSEDSERDIGREDSGEEEWQQALSVGGLGMSMGKGELASLIHQGARAILQTQVGLLLVSLLVSRWLICVFCKRAFVVDLTLAMATAQC